MKHNFSFVNIPELGIDLTFAQRKLHRRELPEGVYWIQPKKRVLWNYDLFRHLHIVCAGDRDHPDHQKLVEKYLETLPQV